MSEALFTPRRINGVGGLRLACRDYNPGAPGVPVLCLPGLTRNARDFTDLAGALSTERRVLCLDARGRGLSEYDPDCANYNPAVEAGDAIAALTALGAPRADIVGTSRGGIQIMLIAGARPDLLRGAVLNDLGPELDPRGLARIIEHLGGEPARMETWDDAAAAVRRANAEQFPDLGAREWEAFARRCFRDEDGRPELDYDPRLRDAVVEAAAEAPADLWPFFEALTPIPTLVVRGALSDILSARTVAKMRAAKPDLRAVEIPRRGHAPFLDEPESLRAIRAFLTDLDAMEST